MAGLAHHPLVGVWSDRQRNKVIGEHLMTNSMGCALLCATH
jgi:hypothetical protein